MPSYNVYSGDSSVLAAKINSTQTSGVTIAAMNINGTLTGWANTAGVIEVSEQSDSTLKREWIYYTGTSVDATTKVATLSGVVRGISSTTSDVTSGGTGVAFSKGATVRFVTFHDLLNKKANLDRANSWTGTNTFGTAGSIIFTNTTSAAFIAQNVTTAQRDALTGVSNGAIIYNSSVGQTQFREGGAWVSNAAGGSVADASTTVAGKVEIATAAERAAATATGGTGATLVVSNDSLAKTSAGAGDENKIPVLSSGGNLALGFLGTGTPAAGKYVDGATGAWTALTPAIPTTLVGGMMLWTTDTAPALWLLCHGQAVSRTTYSALFAVVSTAFGAGDGSTTFNLPDMRGRFPLGQDDMGGSSANRVTDVSADTIGLTGGTADGAHTHTIATTTKSLPAGGDVAVITNTTGSTSVMPPYQTFNYIIFANA